MREFKIHSTQYMANYLKQIMYADFIRHIMNWLTIHKKRERPQTPGLYMIYFYTGATEVESFVAQTTEL